MLKAWDTTRVPGRSSARMRGRRSRFTDDSRYIVSTLALLMSV
jgi:hypothetical protein